VRFHPWRTVRQVESRE